MSCYVISVHVEMNFAQSLSSKLIDHSLHALFTGQVMNRTAKSEIHTCTMLTYTMNKEH